MSEFTVDPGALHAHASQVAGIADQVHTAAAAAGQVGLGGADYGVIISPIMNGLLPHLIPNVSTTQSDAAELGDAIVDGLRANSDVYQRVEDDVTQAMHGVDH
jgi:hypothetical protein